MQWFDNLKISQKLAVTFSIAIAATVGLGGFAMLKMSELNGNMTAISKNWMPTCTATVSMKSEVNALRNKGYQLLTAHTPAEIEKAEREARDTLKELNQHKDVIIRLLATPEEKELVAKIERLLHAFVAEHNKVVALAKSGKMEEAQALNNGNARTAVEALRTAIQEEVDFNVNGATEQSAKADAVYATGRTCIIVAIAASAALVALLGLAISRAIANPLKALTVAAAGLKEGDVEQHIAYESKDEAGVLAESFRGMISTLKSLMAETGRLVTAAKQGQLDQRGDTARFDGAYRQLVHGFNETLDAVVQPIAEASSVLEKVAARDLSSRMQGSYQGDHAQIKNALNSALDNLEEALSQVAVGAEQVTSAATQISNGSQSLAQGASEQASSLEEVSSSLEEMASMTKQNADNSNQGKLLAGEARDAAERGNEAMSRMAGAIGKIKDSSDATAKIVKTIDEIAFQTNLLALNAAVEAARAGEAGKGFAVVAEEVRNLAQRSAEAAKNTANMIEDSVKNAEGGVRITEEVAKALAEIAEGNRKVNDLVAEIAAASGEQSKGIEQINLAVQQLDKVTQQNAANSEESASAAEELNGQAETLAKTVAQFTLRAQTGRRRPTPKPAERRPRGSTRPALPAREQAAPERKRAIGGAAADRNGQSRVSKAALMIPLDDDDFKGF